MDGGQGLMARVRPSRDGVGRRRDGVSSMTDQLTETEKAVDAALGRLLALVQAAGGSLVCKVQIPGQRILKAWGGNVGICLGLAETLAEECRGRLDHDSADVPLQDPT